MYLIRRNTSVDESYEWDSADACVDSEVLDALRFDQSHSNGFQRGRVELRRDQTPGLQDHQQKGEHFLSRYVFDIARVIVRIMLDVLLHVIIITPPHPVLFLQTSVYCVYFFSTIPSPGLPPSVSPPVSKPTRYQYSCSLSEVHFNSLRQEYQEYRRAQASMRSCEPCLTTGNGSDSDSNSALL